MIRLSVIVASSLLIGAAVGCSKPTAKTGAVEAPAAPNVTVGPPVKAAIKHTSEQPGRIEAFEQTPVQAKIAGYVKSVRADIGDEVAAGQLLADLSVPELEQEVEQKKAFVLQAAAEVRQAGKALDAAKAAERSAAAKAEEAKAGRKRVAANHDRWKSEFARVEGMVGKKVLDEQTRDETKNQFASAAAMLEEVEARVRSAEATAVESTARREKSEADVSVAEAKLKVAEADAARSLAMLDYTQIKAPYKGFITERRVNPGELLQPSGTGRDAPLFVLTRSDPLRIFIDVPEADAAFVKAGAKVSVRLPALRGEAITGTITRTSWGLDSHARTLKVAVDVPNPHNQLRPNMYAFGSIATDAPAGWALPASAVVRAGENVFCYLVGNGKAIRTPVQTGVTDGKLVEVLKKQVSASAGEPPAWVDLTGDEKFVLTGVGAVTDGQPIK
jgi:RND family efflux transporter MFP subunit